MTDVENWAAGLCTAAIGLSIVMLLVPSGRIKHTIAVLVGVCYFSCLIAPFGEWCRVGGHVFGNGFSETSVSSEVLELTDEQIDRVIEETLASEANARLSGSGTTVLRADIERDTSPEDGIYIRRVILTTTGTPPSREACTALELAWGVEVEVVLTK